MLFRNTKERYMITNLSVTEFTERLIDHVDLEKKGVLSDSKNEFYGTVSKNSFTLKANKSSLEKDHGIYGEFEDQEGNVIITLEYRESLNGKFAILALTAIILYFLADAAIHSASSRVFIILLIMLAFCIVWIISNIIPRQNELYLALKRIFPDKKIKKARFV